MKQTTKHWLSDPPTNCDVCSTPITTQFVDGKTVGGPWGFMCRKCHILYGFGFGIGRGQQYTKQDDNTWLKTK